MSVIEESGRIRTRSFTESVVAGTYTATVTIPPGAIVRDVRWSNQALWTNTTSATMNVGDAADPNGYFAGVDVKAAPVADVDGAGGISSFDGDAGAGAYSGFAKPYPTGGVITATVVTVHHDGSAGRSTLTVELDFSAPAIAATKA